ncbi:MAG: hypothetical protein AAFN92_08820, partial [Bacteroidota bacterium]
TSSETTSWSASGMHGSPSSIVSRQSSYLCRPQKPLPVTMQKVLPWITVLSVFTWLLGCDPAPAAAPPETPEED